MKRFVDYAFAVASIGVSLCLGGCGASQVSANTPRENTTTIVFASAVVGTDKHHLGRPYDVNFEPLTGPSSRSLFPKPKPHHRSTTNTMDHQRFVIENYRQFAANARAWGIVSGGIEHARSRRYATYRAYQITEVVELDDTTSMRSPPKGALYYLWRIHYGRLFEVVVSGDRKRFHAGARASFLGFGGKVDYVTGRYRLSQKVRGRGLVPKSGAIFATSVEEIRKRYGDDPRYSKSVPIFVEYKRIPKVRVPKAQRFQWERRGTKGAKAQLEPRDLVGAWDVSMNANYSSCDNMKRGTTRKVQWAITFKNGAYKAKVSGAQPSDARTYNGWTESPLFHLRAKNNVGIELKLTGANELRGRRVVANPEPCAIVYDVQATRLPPSGTRVP